MISFTGGLWARKIHQNTTTFFDDQFLSFDGHLVLKNIAIGTFSIDTDVRPETMIEVEVELTSSGWTDGEVDLNDVSPFVDLLVGGLCVSLVTPSICVDGQ